MPHIVILEDESSIADSLIFVLQQESFTTHWESLAAKALAYIERETVDLVIMDVGLPDMTGFEACKQLRRFSEVPVIFLTARSDEVNRVVGLEIGADDYVVKPFSPREVAARVKAILKRSGISSTKEKNKQVPTVVGENSVAATSLTTNSIATTSPTETSLSKSPQVTRGESNAKQEFSIDHQRKLIYYQQQPLNLTRLEFCLLHTLVEQPERVFTRDQLLTAVGIAADAGYERSIDGHIKTLRAKLRAVAVDAEPIKTLRGFGYAYQPESK